MTHSIASARATSASSVSHELRRAALYLQDARENSLRREAALDTGLHHRPDALQPGIDLGCGTQCELVDAHELRNREPGAPGHREQLLAAAEWQRHFGGGRDGCSRLLALALHGAAADRIHLLGQQRCPGRVARRETHAVRMTGQHLVAVEQQVHRLVEGDFAAPEQAQPAAVADALESRLHDRGIETRWIVSLEAEQDGAVRAMPEAGERERPV